eukprot:UN00350
MLSRHCLGKLNFQFGNILSRQHFFDCLKKFSEIHEFLLKIFVLEHLICITKVVF